MTYLMDINSVIASDGAEASLGRLLECMRRAKGFDFSEYKRSSLSRRVCVRMSRVGIADLDSYNDYLRRTPGESVALCNTVWINVTTFFRDPAVWEHMRTCALPELLSRLPAGAPIRIWSAGCASGQEAYSIAMLLAEALGPEEYAKRVTIYATDVDSEALTEARLGIYSDGDTAAIPPEWRDKYFPRMYGVRQIQDELRKSIIFRRQNLLRRRPQGQFDLIICRNTLMYFLPEAQRRVLARLRQSLKDNGRLLLGPAECPIFHDIVRPHIEHFGIADLAAHLYKRV